MNDPHVVALRYRLKHRDTIDYSKAPPLSGQHPDFRVDVSVDGVRFDLNPHFETEEQARRVVDPFVRKWEFDASLRKSPGDFVLLFEKAEIIDRAPTPGVIRVAAEPVRVTIGVSEAKGVAFASAFPPPPIGVEYGLDHPDVQTLHQRYEGYKAGKEPLASFAYFCLTVAKMSVEEEGISAADTYRISNSVLRKIGKLSSTRGGLEARKAAGTRSALDSDERAFLERAVVQLIRRVAEFHGGQGLRPITLADFA